MLDAWLAANNLVERVTVVAAAVAEHAGTAYLRRNTSMGHVLVSEPPDPGATYDRGRFAGQPVYAPTPVVRLDDIPLPAGRPVVLKVDVEGGEIAVLRGAAALLGSGRVTHVVWEINDAFDAVGRLLAEHGYRSVPLDSGNAVSTLG